MEPGVLTDTQYGIFQYFNGISGIALSLLGIVTNILNIKVFLCMGVEDGVTTSFLSLSISDLLSSILNLANCIALVFHGYEYYTHNLLCYYDPLFFIIIFANLCFMTYTVTVLNTTYLAFTRCMCVVMPLHFKNIFTKKRSIIISVMFFASAIVVTTPIFCKIELTPANITDGPDCPRLVLKFPADREKFKDPIYLIILTIVPFTSQIIVLICVFVMMFALRKSTNFRKKFGTQRKPECSVKWSKIRSIQKIVRNSSKTSIMTQSNEMLVTPERKSEKCTYLNPVFDLMTQIFEKESPVSERYQRGSLSVSFTDITTSACSLNHSASANGTAIDMKCDSIDNVSTNTVTTNVSDATSAFSEKSTSSETSVRNDTSDRNATNVFNETSTSNVPTKHVSTDVNGDCSRNQKSPDSKTVNEAVEACNKDTNGGLYVTNLMQSNVSKGSGEDAKAEMKSQNEQNTTESNILNALVESIGEDAIVYDKLNRSHTESGSTTNRSRREIPEVTKSPLSRNESRILQQVVLICVLFVACNVPMIMMGLASMLQPGLDASFGKNRYVRLYYSLQFLRRDIEQLSSSINVFIYMKYNARFKICCRKIMNMICPCLTSGETCDPKTNFPSTISNLVRRRESISSNNA